MIKSQNYLHNYQFNIMRDSWSISTIKTMIVVYFVNMCVLKRTQGIGMFKNTNTYYVRNKVRLLRRAT